jgi:hypothetical protein
VVFELGIKVRHSTRHGPTESQVARHFRNRIVSDEEAALAHVIGRGSRHLVAPLPNLAPVSQFTRNQANHVGALAGLGDKFEIQAP